MKSLVAISTIFLSAFIYGDEKNSYPDYLYEIVGLLDETSAHASGIFEFSAKTESSEDPFQTPGDTSDSTHSDSFGTFWQSEYPSAIRLYSVLNKLRDRKLIEDDISIRTDAVGRTQVTSRSAKELFKSIVIEEDNSYHGWRLRDDFFLSASEEQWDLYFKGVYFRYGIEGYNVIQNPKVPLDRLISYLSSRCLDIVTVRTHTRVPDSTLLIFFPDTELTEKLNLSTLSSVNIVDMSQEPSSFPWSWNYRYDDYDKRYSVTLHLEKLGDLREKELGIRLQYFEWVISELESGIRFYEKNENSISEGRVEELSKLIELIRDKVKTITQPGEGGNGIRRATS